MAQRACQVSFVRHNGVADVLPGTKLAEAAALAGLVVESPCGGEGTCGKCRVTIRQGQPSAATPAEATLLSEAELTQGVRLACQARVEADLVVDVETSSQFAGGHKILADTGELADVPLATHVTKQYVELPEPSRADDCPDVIRLQRTLGSCTIDWPLLAQLGGKLRGQKFRGTAVLAGDRLIDFEAGNTCGASYAIAVDVGTTTLAAALVDLQTGKPRDVASRLNPQTRWGDDVLTRIVFARNEADGLAQLQGAIAKAIDEMAGELVASAGVGREAIYEIMLAGNTTMQQIALGIDPQWLGEVPFAPTLGPSASVPAASLGISIHPAGMLTAFPVIGGFVGGDTVAGIVATGLAQCEKPTLLVDIGTNGEIVLAHRGRLNAASTAAGPAFEGARIQHGMRGSAGAIEKVVIGADGRLAYHVIGGQRPIGICGSGLIDLVAELLRVGVVSCEGRLLVEEMPGGLAARRTSFDGKPAFLLAGPDETEHGRPIVLTQRDIRELQLATGAIRAGIGMLLARFGLAPGDVDTVLLAGGFGNYIRRNHAQRIGLLPPEIPRQRIRYQGNTSLAGAILAITSTASRRAADELARQTEHVDLSRDPRFSMAFAEAMIFPG